MPYSSICSNSKPIYSIHMSNNLSWTHLWELETKLCDKLSTTKLQHIFIIPHSISTIDRSRFSLICPIIKIDSMRPKGLSSVSVCALGKRTPSTSIHSGTENSALAFFTLVFPPFCIQSPKSSCLS